MLCAFLKIIKKFLKIHTAWVYITGDISLILKTYTYTASIIIIFYYCEPVIVK